MGNQRGWTAGLGVVGVAAVVLAWWMLSRTPGLVMRSLREDATQGESRPTSAPARRVLRQPPRRFDPAWDEVRPPDMDAGPIEVVGWVVDERRRPVAGASVELVGDQLSVPPSVTTASDGRFRLEVAKLPADGVRRPFVVAADGLGHAAGRALYPAFRLGRVCDVGALELRQAALITIRVLDDGAAVRGARVFLGGPVWLGVGPLVTDALGMTPPRWVPAGPFVMRAFSEDLNKRGETAVPIPYSGNGPIDVTLSPSRRLGVTVVDAVTSRPVAGEDLLVDLMLKQPFKGPDRTAAYVPGPVPRTDADGRAVINGLPPGEMLEVSVVPPGGFPVGGGVPDSPGWATAAPGDTEIMIKVGEYAHDFRFPVVADETAGPPDGTELRLSAPEGQRATPPPRSGRVVGREVVIDRVSENCDDIIATAPDGTIAELRMLGHLGERKPSEARFKKPRTLVITVRDPSGASLSGCGVQCCRSGDTLDFGGGVGKPARLDENGMARIMGLYPESLEVAMRPPGANPMNLGLVDLTEPGEVRFEAMLEPERSCLVHLTVDGEKRLPKSWHLFVKDVSVGPIEEDSDACTLRFKVRPPKGLVELNVRVESRCCTGAGSLPLTENGSVVEGSIAVATLPFTGFALDDDPWDPW